MWSLGRAESGESNLRRRTEPSVFKMSFLIMRDQHLGIKK